MLSSREALTSDTKVQESVSTPRKCLKTLQQTASDEGSLTGREVLNIKDKLPLKQPTAEVVNKKKVLSKKVQTSSENKITANDLTSTEEPSETYWKILAEKRQAALEETLEENESLLKVIEESREKNALYKQMLEKANKFIEMFKDVVAEGEDDTGIDVEDISSAEEGSGTDGSARTP